MIINYHQPTFDLLEIQPTINPAFVEELNHCERTSAFVFPPAVRQWYELRESIQILAHYSNSDYVLSLEEIEEALSDRRGYRYWDFMEQDMLPIMVENQASCLWAIHLNGSDDPPVGVWDEHNEWHLCAATFSHFVADRVWAHLYWGEACVLVSESYAVDDRQLDLLTARFSEPQCSVLASGVIHIHEDTKHIVIRRQHDGRWLWILRATTSNDLLLLVTTTAEYIEICEHLNIRYPFGFGCAEDILRRVCSR